MVVMVFMFTSLLLMRFKIAWLHIFTNASFTITNLNSLTLFM